jgi:osmotically-inducible protein OsmY
MHKITLTIAAAALALTACTAQQQQRASSDANDAYLVTAVGAKLASIDVDAVTRVHVAASHGVVTLTGQARSAQERARYDDAARSVSGVTAVQDKLTINPQAEGLRGQAADTALTARISAAIAGQSGVNAFRVQPSVHQGMVTLRGTVPSQSIHQTILQTVRGVSGDKSIDDRITVGH